MDHDLISSDNFDLLLVLLPSKLATCTHVPDLIFVVLDDNFRVWDPFTPHHSQRLIFY